MKRLSTNRAISYQQSACLLLAVRSLRKDSIDGSNICPVVSRILSEQVYKPFLKADG